MGVTDYIVIALILLSVGGAIAYIVRAKRRGDACIGCPYARQCGGHCRKPDALPDTLPDALPDALPDTLPDALPDALPDTEKKDFE